jgi:hypothetical protein
MKRALFGLLVICGLIGAFAPTTPADQCAFCGQELEAGTNPLKCPHCIEIAQKIARGNQRVWVLDFKQGPLGRIQIKDDTGDTEVYWYMPYQLKNNDEVAHSFFCDITATSDKGNQEFRYHDLWRPEVYAEAQRILGVREGQQLLSQRDVCMPPQGQANANPTPTDNGQAQVTESEHLRLEATRKRMNNDAAGSTHDLDQAHALMDQARNNSAHLALPTIQPNETLNCVALFQGFDPEMDRLTIKVRGLTNSSIMTHDDYVAPENQPNRRVITEAVLLLDYSRPGDEYHRFAESVVFEGRRWADESRTIKSDLR